jgi:hypothetical protein
MSIRQSINRKKIIPSRFRLRQTDKVGAVTLLAAAAIVVAVRAV